MAYQIQLRHGTAATWTSTNPVLALDEPGVEYNTGQFKVGNGTLAWNSLPYSSGTGPTQTSTYRSLGDGLDGNVSITSGVTTLSRDMYYNNLTISGSGQIFANSFRIYVKGILDITAAGANAINANGSAGGDASVATGGAAVTPPATGSIGTGIGGTAGVTGTSAAGAAATGQAAGTGNGGISNASGAGGTGTNIGGATRSGQTLAASDIRRFESNFLKGITLVSGGGAGGGGGSGGGDNTNNGGGSGAGGNGGGIVALYANIIVKSSATSSSFISAIGGNGGAGGSVAAGICGGGGGGAAGAGGWIYLAYNSAYGPTISGALNASGGSGGTGGNGTGVGATGGNGGLGGYGGRIFVYRVPTATGNEAQAHPNAIYGPETTTGNLAFGLLGGAGTVGDVLAISF